MGALKYGAIHTAFTALSFPGLAGLIRRLSNSPGVIFTLHRVLPEPPDAFAPNAILQVTPAFLEAVILRLRALDIDIVSLDDGLARLQAGQGGGRKFVVLTFDDAYRDNLVYALPILRRHQCPFTLYVPTGLADGTGEIWWQAIEDIIKSHDAIAFEGQTIPTTSVDDKKAAFDVVYWRMRKMPEHERVALIHAFAASHGYDLKRQCRDLVMDWNALQTFADEPLCTIGAHTVRHYELQKLDKAEARAEIAQSADILAERFGRRPDHLSYPLGGPLSAGPREYRLAGELGFKSAVTTIPGGLHAGCDRMALPRVSLNGLFQNERYIDVFATGAIFSVLGRVTG